MRSQRAGERAQWLRVHTALTEGSSVPSTHIRQHNNPVTSVPGDLMLFSPCGYLCACGAHKSMQVDVHLLEKLTCSVGKKKNLKERI